MDTKDKLALAQEIIKNNPEKIVNVVKTDNSLLEFDDKNRIIVTENNKEVLLG